MEDFVAEVSTTVDAPAEKVWEALTKPELIKEYLFGTETETTWKVGEPILWRGKWQGKTYEDKGTILKFEPKSLLSTTYWSGMSGLVDVPENYKRVTYELQEMDGKTKVTVKQSNNSTEEEKKHLEENWKMVLDGLKKVAEAL